MKKKINNMKRGSPNRNTRGTLTSIRAVIAATLLTALIALAMVLPTNAPAQTPSSDFLLSELTVSPKDIVGFKATRIQYRVGVATTVTQATISVTPRDPNATYVITPEDASSRSGHQIDLEPGSNLVNTRVTAEDGSVFQYFVLINRGVIDEFGWKAENDIDDPELQNAQVKAITADGNTIWAVDDNTDALIAYNHNGTRKDPADISLDSSNSSPTGAWTNGTNTWVLNSNGKIFAYRNSDGARQTSLEIERTHSNARHIWSDGTTIWAGRTNYRTLYAYKLNGGAAQTQKNIERHTHQTHDGMWSDGAVMWVVQNDDDRVYAYDLKTGARQRDLEFSPPTSTSNTGPGAIWGNRTTIWIAQLSAQTKVFSHNAPFNNFLKPATVPRQPYNHRLSAGDATITSTWQDQYEDSRARITGQKMRYRRYGSDASWTYVTPNEERRFKTVTGLTNRQAYEVQVASVNRHGTGVWAHDSTVPQAADQSRPPNHDQLVPDPGYRLEVGAQWTDRFGSDAAHPQSESENLIFNSCLDTESFKVYWDQPTRHTPTDYEAHIITKGGAGTHTSEIRREFPNIARTTNWRALFGTVHLHKRSSITVHVRARYNVSGDQKWSYWSRPVGLYCEVGESEPTPLRSEQQQVVDGNSQSEETPNSPAIGSPTITGVSQRGKTLTASISGITDPDGLVNATFTYQWQRNPGTGAVAITGATDTTHTLVEADVGNQVSVRVSFTDDTGNEESLTSMELYVQPPPPLYGDFTNVASSHDGEDTFTLEMYFTVEPTLDFEDVRNNVLSVTNGDITAVRRVNPQSDTPNIHWEITVEPDGDQDVTISLPATTDCTHDGAVCTLLESKLSNSVSTTVPGPGAAATNTAAAGQPAITGPTPVGSTLTASTSAISDPNGMTNAAFSYQWLRDDGEISGTTSSTYVIAEEDEDHTLKVQVSFTDDDDFAESVTSAGLAIPLIPLTGHFDSVPASHGGVNSTVTFQIYFSVEPTLGFVNLRDNVLTVTNGSVTAVRRTDPQGGAPNSRWEITVAPTDDGPVTVTFSATTDCSADSAVCTTGGKMLSNSASITIAGP